MDVEVGAILEGKVSGITNFGVFVDIGETTGMVHISEVARNYVKDLKEYVQVGQTVKVKIISVSPEGKIALSGARFVLKNEDGLFYQYVSPVSDDPQTETVETIEAKVKWVTNQTDATEIETDENGAARTTSLCTGCGVCADICPAGAIHRGGARS